MKKFFKYGSILFILILIWDASIVQPIRAFVTYIHQGGHLLAGLLFSYKPGVDIYINLTETAYQIVNQKSFISAFLIANAGYVANLVFILFALYLKQTSSKRFMPGIFAIAFVSIAYTYAGISHHLLYAALFAGFAIVLHMIHKDPFYDYLLNIIAMANFAFILFDVLYNTIYYELNLIFGLSSWKRDIPYSDALQLQNLTRIPPLLWGILWGIILLTCSVVFLIEKNASVEESFEEE
jgi:hypothetical protein